MKNDDLVATNAVENDGVPPAQSNDQDADGGDVPTSSDNDRTTSPLRSKTENQPPAPTETTATESKPSPSPSPSRDGSPLTANARTSSRPKDYPSTPTPESRTNAVDEEDDEVVALTSESGSQNAASTDSKGDHDDEEKDEKRESNDVSAPNPTTFSPITANNINDTAPSKKPSVDDDDAGEGSQPFTFDFSSPSNNNNNDDDDKGPTPRTDDQAHKSFDFSLLSNALTPRTDDQGNKSYEFSLSPNGESALFHPGEGVFGDADLDVGDRYHQARDVRIYFAMDKEDRKRRNNAGSTSERRDGDRPTPRATVAREPKDDDDVKKNESPPSSKFESFSFHPGDGLSHRVENNDDVDDDGEHRTQPFRFDSASKSRDKENEREQEKKTEVDVKDDRIHYISSLLESIKGDDGVQFDDGVLDELRATTDVGDVWDVSAERRRLEHDEDEEHETETAETEEDDSVEKEKKRRPVAEIKYTSLEEEREKQQTEHAVVARSPAYRKRSSTVCRRHSVCDQCIVQ